MGITNTLVSKVSNLNMYTASTQQNYSATQLNSTKLFTSLYYTLARWAQEVLLIHSSQQHN